MVREHEKLVGIEGRRSELMSIPGDVDDENKNLYLAKLTRI